MATIEEVLSRRTDLSTFLVHLTRGGDDTTARQNLEAIIQQRCVEARTAFGHAVKALGDAQAPNDSQRCVCFTETPLEHVSLLAQNIEGRRACFAPYGIAITKKQARRLAVNPVWYVDITPGHDWLTGPLNALVGTAIRAGNFDTSDIAKLTPFVEHMGSGGRGDGDNYRKEFWWEREWRHVGDFHIPSSFLILCPEGQLAGFKRVVQALDVGLHVGYLDPRWSMEQVVAHLAGFSTDDVGPM